MKERVREKIALVVLVALVALAGFAIVAYFASGRSWSVAATLMDDAVGRMSGYTALVFKAEEDETTSHGVSDALGHARPSAMANVEPSVPSDTDTIGLRIMSYYVLVNPNGIKEIDPQAVADLYEEKGANAAVLDVSEYGIGSDSQVIEVGDKKVGVFYAVGYRSESQVAKIVSRLRERGAEAILCITPRLSTLQSTSGINAVLVSDVNDELASGGVRSGDTLICAFPPSGRVGVILFSSNNTATARVIDAL